MRKFVSLGVKDLPDGYDAEGLGGQPVVEVKESNQLIELSYRFPGFFRAEVDGEVRGRKMRFDLLDVEGLGRILESGRPELPSFGRYVQIPPGCEWKVSVETRVRPLQFDGVCVAPAQARMMDGVEAHEFEYDEVYYARDELLPRDLVAVTGPFHIDGYVALAVHACPFQYNPGRGLLLVHPQIDVKIALSQRAGAAGPSGRDAESREAFGNLFLNPRREVGPRVNLPLEPIRPILPSGPELLIVHAKAFGPAARLLADWKNRRGLLTELLEFGGGVSTLDGLKGEIRRRRRLRGSRLGYVLLVGDAADIPVESRGGIETDYFYSTPEDVTAAVPFPLPWLAVGRIPVRDAAEAVSVVNQIVGYERNPPADPGYYRRFVCAAHFETSAGRDGRDYVFTMEAIRAFLTAQGYDAERVYTCDTATRPLRYRNGSTVPADVAAAIMNDGDATARLVDSTSEGHLVLAHRDHGSPDGWVHPQLRMADLDRVAGTVPSLFFSVNCVTGCFQATTTTECFAEKLLRMPGAAPTLIAATENSATFINNAMMLGLFDALYGGLLPTFPGTTASYPVRFNRIGDVLNYARCYERLIHGSGADVLGHHEMFHVLGDPTLEVWTREPKPLRLATAVRRSVLEIELDPLVPGSVVTLWSGGSLLRRITPLSRRISIPLPPIPPFPPSRRVLAVCGWAPGCRYAERRIVIPMVPSIPVPVA